VKRRETGDTMRLGTAAEVMAKVLGWHPPREEPLLSLCCLLRSPRGARLPCWVDHINDDAPPQESTEQRVAFQSSGKVDGVCRHRFRRWRCCTTREKRGALDYWSNVFDAVAASRCIAPILCGVDKMVPKLSRMRYLRLPKQGTYTRKRAREEQTLLQTSLLP